MECYSPVTLLGLLAQNKVASAHRNGRVVGWCRVNFQCRGVLLFWVVVGQGPTALDNRSILFLLRSCEQEWNLMIMIPGACAGGDCLDIFSLFYNFSLLSPSLWATARYRLQYCLKGSLKAKQPTNQNHRNGS